MKILYAFLD